MNSYNSPVWTETKIPRNSRRRPPAKIFRQSLVWYCSWFYTPPLHTFCTHDRICSEEHFGAVNRIAGGCATTCLSSTVCPVLSLMHDRAPAYCSMDPPLFRHDHSPDLVWWLLIRLVYETAVELEDDLLPAQDPVSMWQHTTKAWYFERVGQTDFAPLRFLQ